MDLGVVSLSMVFGAGHLFHQAPEKSVEVHLSHHWVLSSGSFRYEWKTQPQAEKGFILTFN